MDWDHVILHGTLVSGTNISKGHIYLKDGKIAAISDRVLDGKAKKTTDATGLYVLPGLIDSHVHSRDGGALYKEDFFHSTKAAAAGGITTIFEMPNTDPTVNNVQNFHKQVANFKQKAHVNFGLWGICLGDLNNAELQSLHDAGVVGFKYFWGYAVNEKTFQLVYTYEEGMENILPPCDDGEVYEMFRAVAQTGNTIAVHAENSYVINRLTKNVMEKNPDDYETFLSTRGHLAEVLTVQTAIALAKQTGARLHILHVTTKDSVELIRQAQQAGYSITAETCPHYLFLTKGDFKVIGSVMKVYPLVKDKADQDALWEGIQDGTISIVSSDHAPHTKEEKTGDIWTIPAGMCGVETIVPLMLNAVNEGKLTLQEVVQVLAENPAKHYRVFPEKGHIQVGADADITIVDMDREWTIKEADLQSKSKVTAFDGLRVKGKPVQTIVGGNVVMNNGEIVDDLFGTLVKPNNR